MKVVAKPGFARQLKKVPNALRAGITGAVNGPVYRPRFLADILHDIDLAAVGPSSRFVAHHPKSRPKPLPRWDLDARLEAAVALGKLAFGVDACRSVTTGDVIGPDITFLYSFND